MAALAGDFVTLLLQRQAVDLDYVVQHASEGSDHFAVFVPVEICLVGERLAHELGEVDRAQQAGAIRRQRLFAAGVGGANVLAEPVVVHLVDAVDEDEARLGEVVGGGHDDVPQTLRLDGLVDAAGNLAIGFAGQVFVLDRPFAPDYLAVIFQVELVGFCLTGGNGESQLPLGIGFHRFHEFPGDQAGQVELAQTAGFALGLDEVGDVRMRDVEGRHLCATAATGGRHGEAHLVVDIHEGQRAAGVGAGAGDEGALGTQRGEFVTDAATGFQGQAGFMHFFQDAVHAVFNRAGYGAVDRGGGGLVFQRAGVGGDAAGGNGAAAQGPDEFLVPQFAFFFRVFGIGQCARHATVGVVHVRVQTFTLLGFQAVLLVPDIEGDGLHGNFFFGLLRHFHGLEHGSASFLVLLDFLVGDCSAVYRRKQASTTIYCDWM